MAGASRSKARLEDVCHRVVLPASNQCHEPQAAGSCVGREGRTIFRLAQIPQYNLPYLALRARRPSLRSCVGAVSWIFPFKPLAVSRGGGGSCPHDRTDARPSAGRFL